jgi:hypothetical protein
MPNKDIICSSMNDIKILRNNILVFIGKEASMIRTVYVLPNGNLVSGTVRVDIKIFY